MEPKTKTKKKIVKKPRQQDQPSDDIVLPEPVKADVDDVDSESSEEEPEWTPNDEKTFLQTLGALKGNSEDIYNNGKRFWNSAIELKPTKTSPKKKEQPMFLKDYERKLILEKGGKLSDDDEEDDIMREPENEPSYFEQQEEIRRKLRETLEDPNEDDEDDLFKAKVKTTTEKEEEENEYYEWLKGQKQEDLPGASEIKSLKEAWTKPDIDEDEKFLRDYLLNKEYETGNSGITADDLDEVDEDDEQFEQQTSYEHKYNFRFEDPDQDFIKQYPRTVNESIRQGQNKRKEKREEYKQRKNEEKEEAIKTIKQKKQATKKQIELKLKKLKEFAGDDVAINIDDLEGDFDPKEYDKRMQELFNDDYYKRSDAFLNGGCDEEVEDEEKPIFTDDDEDYDDPIDSYEHQESDQLATGLNKQVAAVEPSDEDEQKYREKPASRRKQKRKTGKTEKPLFNPEEKTFEEYFNEYHALDYEDVIGDQVTRFRYRNVMPNNYGLTADEILSSEDNELNKWVSLKKATGFKSQEEELYDLKAYENRSNDFRKGKIFKSWFGKNNSNPAENTLDNEDDAPGETKDKKKRQRKRKVVPPSKSVSESIAEPQADEISSTAEPPSKKKRTRKPKATAEAPSEPPKKTRTRKPKSTTIQTASTEDEKKNVAAKQKPAVDTKNRDAPLKNKKIQKEAKVSDDRLMAYGINPKKFNAGKKFGKRR